MFVISCCSLVMPVDWPIENYYSDKLWVTTNIYWQYANCIILVPYGSVCWNVELVGYIAAQQFKPGKEKENYTHTQGSFCSV